MLEVRKTVSVVEVTHREMGRAVDGPRRKVATAIVMRNPFAGSFVDDLTELVELGAPVGELLVSEALAVLGARAEQVTAYGKAAIVGSAGEIGMSRSSPLRPIARSTESSRGWR